MKFSLMRAIANSMRLRGTLKIRKISGTVMADLSWRLKNFLRINYLEGLFAIIFANVFTALTGRSVLVAELSAVKVDSMGRKTNYGVVARRLVTNNGVQFLTDSWRGTKTIGNMKYHGCGTGTTAEAVGDSALVTECTTALNPDSTRATGSLAGSGNAFTTVGTLTFDASAAVTEHGLFDQAATGGGVLFDRSVFTAINVVSGDSIQFTYTVTLTAGG